MKTRMKYLCSVCESEYTLPAEAEKCSALGYPVSTNNLHEGDIISFSREEKGEGESSLRTYIRESGKILYKFTVLNTKENNHQDVMICEVDDPKDGKPEKGVLMVNIGGEPQLFSPSDYHFPKGQAAWLRQCNPHKK